MKRFLILLVGTACVLLASFAHARPTDAAGGAAAAPAPATAGSTLGFQATDLAASLRLPRRCYAAGVGAERARASRTALRTGQLRETLAPATTRRRWRECRDAAHPLPHAPR